MLAEDHVRGASIGELGKAIIADQFQRLRDGDRFWFENGFSGRQLEQLEKTRLSDIIQRNTQINNLQQNVFVMRAEVSGKVLMAANSVPAVRMGGAQPAVNRPSADNLGLSGITLELIDDQGETIDTTVTNGRGQYTFSSFDETGDYRIRIVLEPNLQTRLDSLDIRISKGATRLRELNFVVTRV